MYCKNCGQEVNNEAVVCPHCGVPIRKEMQTPTEKKGTGMGIGAIIAGLFIPILGIILGCVAISQGNKTQNKSGVVTGTVGVVVSIASWIISAVIFSGLIS